MKIISAKFVIEQQPDLLWQSVVALEATLKHLFDGPISLIVLPDVNERHDLHIVEFTLAEPGD